MQPNTNIKYKTIPRYWPNTNLFEFPEEEQSSRTANLQKFYNKAGLKYLRQYASNVVLHRLTQVAGGRPHTRYSVH